MTSTVPTTPSSSTTSTSTGCRAASLPIRAALAPWMGGQSGAMGEAWSDWYALDFLAGPGLRGRHRRCRRASRGPPTRTRSIREQAFDCPVGVVISPRARTAATPRRLREDPRLPGDPRRRRDLGRDAVGSSWRIDCEARRGHRSGTGSCTGDRRHAAVAPQPHLPPNARFHPAGRRRPWLRRTRSDLGGVRGTRNGLPRLYDGDFDTSPVEDFSVPPPLPPPASPPSSSCLPGRHDRRPSWTLATRTRFRVGSTARHAPRSERQSAVRSASDSTRSQG